MNPSLIISFLSFSSSSCARHQVSKAQLRERTVSAEDAAAHFRWTAFEQRQKRQAEEAEDTDLGVEAAVSNLTERGRWGWGDVGLVSRE